MKVILQQYGSTISVEVGSDDLTLGQIVENLIRPVLMGAGFSLRSTERVLGPIDEDALGSDV